MTEAKHTPGPWEAEGTVRQIAGYFDGSGIEAARYWHAERIIGANGDIVGHVSRHKGDDRTYLESIANARLIAAAPELLEALKTFVSLCPSSEGLGGHAPIGAFNIAADKARAAIAKATQSTP